MSSTVHEDASDDEAYSVDHDSDDADNDVPFLFADDESHEQAGPAAADEAAPLPAGQIGAVGGAGGPAHGAVGIDDDDDGGPDAAGPTFKGGLTFVHVHADNDKGPVKRSADGNAKRVEPKRNVNHKFDAGMSPTAAQHQYDWSTPGASFENFIGEDVVINMWKCTSERMNIAHPSAPLLDLAEVYDMLAIQVSMGLRYQPTVPSYWDAHHVGEFQ
jgi:hypothetical protein